MQNDEREENHHTPIGKQTNKRINKRKKPNKQEQNQELLLLNFALKFVRFGEHYIVSFSPFSFIFNQIKML